MTVDQTLHLLAICAWPAVALIAGTAFVHGIRLLVDATESILSCVESWRKTYLETQLLLESRRSDTAVGVASIQSRTSTRKDLPPTDKVRLMSEQALLAILQANGGFPGSRGDDTTRQLVREIRKMFAEIERPTPEPEPLTVTGKAEYVDSFDVGDLEDVEDPEEVFGP